MADSAKGSGMKTPQEAELFLRGNTAREQPKDNPSQPAPAGTDEPVYETGGNEPSDSTGKPEPTTKPSDDESKTPDSKNLADAEKSGGGAAGSTAGADEQQRLGLGGSNDRAGRGYRKNEPSEHTKMALTPKGWIRKNRKKLFGGGLAGFIAGLVLMFSVASGPLQVVHYSQILTKSFSNHDIASGVRLGGLWRWAKTGDIGQTRIGRLGSEMIPMIDKKLAKQGIEVTRGKFTGQIRNITIDTSKNSLYKGMPESEMRAAIAEREGLPIEKVQKIRGSKGGSTIFDVDFSDQKTSVKRATVFSGHIGEAVKQQSLGKISSSAQLRTYARYINASSLLHPWQRKIAEKKAQVENKKILRDQDKARKKGVVAVSEEAQLKAASLKNSLKVGAGFTGGALLLAGGICTARDVAGAIPEINRDNIVIPSMRSAIDAMAMGAQIQSGQDVDLAQVGVVVEGFKDKDGNTIWDGEALRAQAGREGGVAIDPSIKQAYSPNSTASEFKKTVDELGASYACSKIGLITQGVLGGALLFVPGAGWAAKGLGLAAGATAIAVITEVLPKVLADDPLVATPHEGPKGGNIDAFGARELANSTYRSSGGTALSPTQSSYLQTESDNQAVQEFNSKSILSRIFNVHDYNSLVSRLIDKQSSSPIQNISTLARSLLDINGWATNFASLFVPQTYAAEKAYDYGFPQYGFSQEALDDPLVEDPYANAEVAANLLKGPDGEKYKQKAKACFGVDIANGANGWDAIVGGDVNPTSAEYIEGNCADSNDKDWLRIRFFIFDTQVMKSYACYEGDEVVCGELGFGENQSTDTSGTTSTAGAQIIGNIGNNSNTVACAPGTNDLDVVTTKYTGSYKLESGPLIIRLCQVPDIPGQGNNAQGVEINGGAIVNSRVSGAWLALGKAAKVDGIDLYSNSSFRLADSCEGTGTGGRCATPGGSPHQIGVAIDFRDMSGVDETIQICSARLRDLSSPSWKWMYKNAELFGLEQYSAEAWHWDPLPASNRCNSAEPLGLVP